MTDSPTPPAGADAPNPLRDPRDRRLPLIAGPSSMVMFGVTGDLARKKLLPALYDLDDETCCRRALLWSVWGRRDWSDADFAREVEDYVRAGARTAFSTETWQRLAAGLRFVPAHGFDDDGRQAFDRLTEPGRRHDSPRNRRKSRVLPLDPAGLLRARLREALQHQLNPTPVYGSWSRVIIREPFGHDLTTAHKLNHVVE